MLLAPPPRAHQHQRANTHKNYGILWMWTRKGGGLIWRDPLLFSGFEAAWHRHVCAMLRCTFRCLNLWSGQKGNPLFREIRQRCGRVLKLIQAKDRMQHGASSSSDLTCLLLPATIPIPALIILRDMPKIWYLFNLFLLSKYVKFSLQMRSEILNWKINLFVDKRLFFAKSVQIMDETAGVCWGSIFCYPIRSQIQIKWEDFTLPL